VYHLGGSFRFATYNAGTAGSGRHAMIEPYKTQINLSYYKYCVHYPWNILKCNIPPFNYLVLKYRPTFTNMLFFIFFNE
jgi:hypothetical protein